MYWRYSFTTSTNFIEIFMNLSLQLGIIIHVDFRRHWTLHSYLPPIFLFSCTCSSKFGTLLSYSSHTHSYHVSATTYLYFPPLIIWNHFFRNYSNYLHSSHRVTFSPYFPISIGLTYLTSIEICTRWSIECPFTVAFSLFLINAYLSLQVNNDPEILPNVSLVLRWNDTKGDTFKATQAMTEMICDGIAVFFGPEGFCYVESIVSQSRNIPMISYVSIFYLLIC